MRSSVLVIAVLICIGCSRNDDEPVSTVQHIENPAEDARSSFQQRSRLDAQLVDEPLENLEGAWVLGNSWLGFMGVAIKFESDRTFKYWFYTDVGRPESEAEPTYPFTGTWSWSGPILELKSDQSLHDMRWYVYRGREEPMLLPEYAHQWKRNGDKRYEGRFLFRSPNLDEADPFSAQ